MTTTTAAIALEPVVGWPREAAPGGRYLVTVDLHSEVSVEDWPYPDEEYAVGLMLSGGSGLTVESLGQLSVVLHRFGGTYGPARYVVTVSASVAEGTETALWLSLVSAGGVPFHKAKLPITVTRDAPVSPVVPGVTLPRVPQMATAAARPPVTGSDVWSVVTLTGGTRPVLALGGDDGALRLWERGTSSFRSLDIGVGSVRVAVPAGARGRWLVAGAGNTIVAVDPVDLRVLWQATHEMAGWITSLCLVHPTVEYGVIAVGTSRGQILLFDPAKPTPSAGTAMLKGPIHALCNYQRESRNMLVAGGPDGTLTVLNAARLTVVRRLRGHTAGINQLTATLGPRAEPRILSASDDGTVRVWDLASNTSSSALQLGASANAVVVLPGYGRGAPLVAGDRSGALWFWSKEFGTRSFLDDSDAGAVTALATFKDGDRDVLAVLRRGGVIQLRDAALVTRPDSGTQEFVAHLFAPLDGPDVELALRQLRDVWEGCRKRLGMTQRIAGTSLSTVLPTDPRSARQGALAGLQDQTVDFQVIVRREGDVLNLSLMLGASVVPQRQQRFGLTAPPGWREYVRWWRDLTRGGTDALLGCVTVCQAAAPDPEQAHLLDSLPDEDADTGDWRTRRISRDGLVLWEVGEDDDPARRRLVVLARPDEDARLNHFTWSDGGVALPPLGRYLMHAAQLRHQVRMLGNSSPITRLRNEIVHRDAPAGSQGTYPEVAAALESLRSIQRNVDTARDTMTTVLPGLLHLDAAVATYIETRIAEYSNAFEFWRMRRERMAFAVDVVRYSDRSTPQQVEVQRHLAGLVERVLDEIGVPMQDVDRQDVGDGMFVVLPSYIEPYQALPRLLHGWRTELRRDNNVRFRDRIRLRLSVSAGPISSAAVGFSGATIVETGRLLNSEATRRAVDDYPDADLVAVVSERLHAELVEAGQEAAEFQLVHVQAKSYDSQAWLWLPPLGEQRQSGPASPAPVRDVLVVHGNNEPARAAFLSFLRAIDLRPLDWEHFVARTGTGDPRHSDVLRQAFAENIAVVVLFARGASPDFLAGMAVALQPDRTVLVRLGDTRLPGDLASFVVIDLAGPQGLLRLAKRLRRLGYAVNTDGTDWLDMSRFAELES